MDEFTMKHFAEWLDRAIAEDEREQVEQNILLLLTEYPELLETHSWPEMRKMAELKVEREYTSEEYWASKTQRY